MKLSPEQPLAGILEPVFAIRTETDLGVGDTDGVRQMIDWCAQHGLHIFQTLPINETSDDNSPYNAISSLAIEPTTIAISPNHLPDLSADDFKEIAKPALLAELRQGAVNYPKVKALKRELLEAGFKNFVSQHFNKCDDARPSGRFDSDTASGFSNHPGDATAKRTEVRAPTPRALDFRAFLMENADWLSDYALFRLLMEENGNSPAWDRWQPEHLGPRRARTWLLSLPEKRRDDLMRRQLFFMYVQWIAFSQWKSVKDYGTEKNVFLMGDIPFGVGRYSADVWANRSIFDLDWSGGAPPEHAYKADPFTAKWGQNWGIPNYRWDELRRHDFEWWRTRIENLLKVFHLYRIDHVLGFFRIYSFPWPPERNAEFLRCNETEAADKTGGRLPGFKQFPDDTPEHTAANQAQGEELLRVVLDASGDTAVIAEDLGVVPEYVRPTLEKLKIPGFCIPLFSRNHDGSYYDPKKYPRLSLAQPATHDHAPMAALWAEFWEKIDANIDADEMRHEQRRFMDFAGLKNEEPPREFADRLHEGFTDAVLQSNAWFAIFQITDVFAQTARFNVPGSMAASNWSHRLPQTVEGLSTNPGLAGKAKMFSRLARESGRTVTHLA